MEPLPRPWATMAIAALTIACWLAASAAGAHWVPEAAGFIPYRLAHAVPAGSMGLPWQVPAWATPLSATLVHGSLMHLFFNMLMLGFCGRFVEAELGSGRFVLLYVAAAYLAAGAQWLTGPLSGVPMIGASGAVSAMVAAQAILFGVKRPRRWRFLSEDVLNILWLAAAWTGLQVLTNHAFGGGLAVAAHLGGFVAGLLLAEPLSWRREAQPSQDPAPPLG